MMLTIEKGETEMLKQLWRETIDGALPAHGDERECGLLATHDLTPFPEALDAFDVAHRMIARSDAPAECIGFLTADQRVELLHYLAEKALAAGEYMVAMCALEEITGMAPLHEPRIAA